MQASGGAAIFAGLVLLSGCSPFLSPTEPTRAEGKVPPAQAERSKSVAVLAPVRYILIPGTSIYYVDGVSPEVFFFGGNFYVQLAGVWHLSQDYQGPWAAVPADMLPKPLRGQTPAGLKSRAPSR